jgi:hypothetical protein
VFGPVVVECLCVVNCCLGVTFMLSSPLCLVQLLWSASVSLTVVWVSPLMRWAAQRAGVALGPAAVWEVALTDCPP